LSKPEDEETEEISEDSEGRRLSTDVVMENFQDFMDITESLGSYLLLGFALIALAVLLYLAEF
jgi:hypothetical protein